MELKLLPPKKILDKAFQKQRPLRSEIEGFKNHLTTLLSKINEIESEENQKNHLRDFLLNTYYLDKYEVNTKENKDLVIHLGKTNTEAVGVIVEAKKPSNKAEMISEQNANCKALHELILYYFDEREKHNNTEQKQLIATNIHQWYIFDANTFDQFIYKNSALKKLYKNYVNDKKTTDFFYTEAAKIIAKSNSTLECVYFDIRDYEDLLSSDKKEDIKRLIALFKILSPQHLLKLPIANDSNALNEKFYRELLHIIGLEEHKEGSKTIIRRVEKNRQSGSLIEMVISMLETKNSLRKVPNLSEYGENKQEQLFAVALQLCITWVNRLLFLKLLEAQLKDYHNGDTSYTFLNIETLPDFDELFKLFHNVLAKPIAERTPEIQNKYSKVPYLNSSLFDFSDIEDATITVNDLDDNAAIISFYSHTKLKARKKDEKGLQALEYLFAFLNAYDFASEAGEGIQEDESHQLINASVLGKVFEKINGYKDGSIYTPGFITMYMCRQAIRPAVVQKFNEAYGWELEEFSHLYNYLDKLRKPKDILAANAVINSLHICDPAVGSGHFLVSALNELIAIKYELGILADENGKTFRNYDLEIANDELIITDSDDEFFSYHIANGKPAHKESQRLQESLFKEKQTLIENCLFGVDINPNSVKICRLRLWIELLKNAYYKKDTGFAELETLPNIDINIKSGNSLLSRFDLDADLRAAFNKQKFNLSTYKLLVENYHKSRNKEEKDELLTLINKIKEEYSQTIYSTDPRRKKLSDIRGQLELAKNAYDLFGKRMKEGERKIQERRLTLLLQQKEKELEEAESGKLYSNAFEWRFEFPEVLNEKGDFIGFDVVIGNPPYIKEYDRKSAFDGLRKLPCYQGKMDIWYLFGCLGLSLLKDNRELCYIATNNWVTNSGASKFRNVVVKNARINALIDFGAFMIFENAAIQTMVMHFTKNSSVENYDFDYRYLKGSKPPYEDAVKLIKKEGGDNIKYLSPDFERENYINSALLFNNNKIDKLLQKIKNKCNVELRGRADKKHDLKAEVAQGIVAPQDSLNASGVSIMGERALKGDGVFVLSQNEFEEYNFSEKEQELIKPYYTTHQLHKYYGEPANTHWIIYTKSDVRKLDKKINKRPIDDYPTIKKHLDKYAPVITSDFGPYGLHRAREQHFFEGEKIISLRKCPIEPTFTYTDFDCYVSQTFYVIQSDRINLKYLTGLLNSLLIKFWLKNKGKMQGNNYQVDKAPILELPIYNPNGQESEPIINLVDKILAAKKENPDADTTAWEAEIDQLVYQLYNLTPEEIAIVEGKTN